MSKILVSQNPETVDSPHDEIAKEIMLSESLVVLDFETSGLSPRYGDRVTEVGAVRIQANRIVEQFDSLVNCGVRLDPFIIQYTGITQRMVDTAPSAEKVMDQLVRFIGSSPVVAHNASFDQRFFDSECSLARVRSAIDPFICSLRVSRRIFPQYGSHALGNIASDLGIRYPAAAHRAAADAIVTANLMIRIAMAMKERFSRLSIDACLLRSVMKMPVAKAGAKLEKLAGQQAAIA